MAKDKKENLFFKAGLLILIIAVFFIGLFQFSNFFELKNIFSEDSNFREIISRLDELNEEEKSGKSDLIWESSADDTEDKEDENEKSEGGEKDNSQKESDLDQSQESEEGGSKTEEKNKLKSFEFDILIERIDQDKIVGVKDGLEIDLYFTENYKVQINPITEREKAIEEEAEKYLDEELCPKVEQEIVDDYRLKEATFEDIREGDKAHVRGDYDGDFLINRIILLR